MPQEITDHDRIVQMHAVLLGVNGQGGLARQVKHNTRNIEKNAKAITRLLIGVVIIALSCGGSVFGIVKAVLAINGG